MTSGDRPLDGNELLLLDEQSTELLLELELELELEVSNGLLALEVFDDEFDDDVELSALSNPDSAPRAPRAGNMTRLRFTPLVAAATTHPHSLHPFSNRRASARGLGIAGIFAAPRRHPGGNFCRTGRSCRPRRGRSADLPGRIARSRSPC